MSQAQYGGYANDPYAAPQTQYGPPQTQYDPGYAANPQYAQGAYGGNYAPGVGPEYGGGMPAAGQANFDWSVVFFAAACSIMLGAFIGGIALFFSFELVDFIEMCYMLLFGGVLAVMDTPCFKTLKTVKDHREYFSKYVNLLTRLMGKGITFLFLGCSLFSGMWDNLESNLLLFLAFILCLLPVVVGVAAVGIGFMKSQKLTKARLPLAQDETEALRQFDQCARTYPYPSHQGGGLTQAEFSDLTNKSAGIKWEDSDLKLIFNALVSNPAWRTNHTSAGGQQGELAKMPKEDFMAWVSGGVVWL